ncbi:hypothetical protein Daesc_006181 [Daldinia eschscholtzii]|uniref:Uncharacterized protein n=1 Tax=Daldinia eschscholtzii TaxID=292717 RepID=A0AAX6MG26_9PEZI
MESEATHRRRRITDFFSTSKLVGPLRDHFSSSSKNRCLSSPVPITTETEPPDLLPLDQAQSSQSSQSLGSSVGQAHILSQGTGSLASSGLSRRAIARRDRVLKEIEDHFAGKYEGKPLLIKRKLLYREYRSLCKLISESTDERFRDYFNQELRYDYGRYEKDKQFVIRMPSAYHECMAGSINSHITDWLKDVREKRSLYKGVICEDPETINIAKNIKPTLATRVDLSGNTDDPAGDNKDPDLSFRLKHPETIGPGLVVEVAWSQRDLNLPRIARSYIEKANGRVRTVIGINLNDIYKSRRVGELYTGTATFSTWKAEFDSKDNVVSKCTAFRDADGKPNPGGTIHLSLQDFIYQKTVEKIKGLQNPDLVISPEDFSEFFVDALEQGQAEERRKKRVKANAERENVAEQDVVPMHDAAAQSRVAGENPAPQTVQETEIAQSAPSPARYIRNMWENRLRRRQRSTPQNIVQPTAS